MYRPNFCVDCGERIARVRWRVWTSRRFCRSCERRFRRRRFAAPLAASVALFGFGFMAGRQARPTPPPLVVERGELPPVVPAARPGLAGSAADRPAPRYGPDGSPDERPTDPGEIVSVCGARTKKGTPCQRRVRGTGRCWQHRGKPASIPPHKLIVTGN